LEKLSIKKGEYLKTLGGEVCAEGENVENYNKRLKAIFENKRLVSWPFGGRVGFLEKDYRGGRANLHVFDNWCHVATLQREEEIYDFENLNSDLKFDLGVYQLLVDFLQKGKRLRVVKI
jgi:DNA polymerase-3 subunit epsilon